MISFWYRRGVLAGHQRGGGSPLGVGLTEEDIERLRGSTPLRAGLMTVSEAAQEFGKTVGQVWEEVRAGGLVLYRLKVKHRWRWCVSVPAERGTHTGES